VIGKSGLGSGEGGSGSGPALRDSGQIGTYNRSPRRKKKANITSVRYTTKQESRQKRSHPHHHTSVSPGIPAA
jgi:hypothetical protein